MTTFENTSRFGVGKILFLIALAIFSAMGLVVFSQSLSTGAPPALNPTAVSPLNTRDFEDAEWTVWMDGVTQYNVDVYIPSSHAALSHSAEEMNAALRACNEHGTVSVISDNYTRRLNLLCRDPETGREFVVIINKIKKSVDSFKNATSELITAFELKAGSVQPNIAAYIQGEVNIAKTGILVRLAFKAGELFFSPYK